MNAFYKHANFQAKAIKNGDSWQILSNGEKEPETWHKLWSDNLSGSLKFAISRHCELNGILFLDDDRFLSVNS